MKTKDHIYIQILTWAYDKQQTGFTREEMNEKFNLKGELFTWVNEAFFFGTNDDRPLMSVLIRREEKDYFALSGKGISAAIDYLELKEARESSKEARMIAIISIIIGIIVGIAQIIVAFNQ
jgi:hypothetical protein